MKPFHCMASCILLLQLWPNKKCIPIKSKQKANALWAELHELKCKRTFFRRNSSLKSIYLRQRFQLQSKPTEWLLGHQLAHLEMKKVFYFLTFILFLFEFFIFHAPVVMTGLAILSGFKPSEKHFLIINFVEMSISDALKIPLETEKKKE